MINKNTLSLDPRLSMLAEMVGCREAYVDIGCDHGRLGAYLLQTGRVQRATLTDISPESLKKARRLIRLLGLENRVDFRICDGIPKEAEKSSSVVIAGMGGVLIADILKNGRDRLGSSELILQPNVAQAHLRQALSELGYRIEDEKIVKDGRRFYSIERAVPGAAHYSRAELLVGPVLLRQKPEPLYGYADFRIRVLEKALTGARNGNERAETDTLEEELTIWKKLKNG